MQIFANLDEEDPDYQRMLYVFTCLSPECIGTQRSIKVFRGYARDDGKTFANEEEIDKFYDMDEGDVIKMGLVKDTSSEENKNVKQSQKERGITFEEFIIETDIEAEDVSKFY